MNLMLGRRRIGDAIEFDGKPNGHLFISGTSGQGKSWKLRSLAQQVEKQGGRVYIIDFSGDLSAPFPQQGWNPEIDAEVIDLRAEEYALNLFEPWDDQESPDDIAERVTDMIMSGIKMTQTQWMCLMNAIDTGLKYDLLKTMEDLYVVMTELAEKDDVAKRLLPRMMTLARLLPKGAKEIEWKEDTPGITIFNLNKYRDRSARTLVTEMILNAICALRMSEEPGQGIPLVVLVDECQAMPFKENSPEVILLREGRKYNISGWFATQWIDNPVALAALGQAGRHIYFRPSENDLHKVARTLSRGAKDTVDVCERKLAKLKVGQFIVRDKASIIMSAPPNS